MKKSIVLLGGNKLHQGFEEVKKRLDLKEIIVIDWNEKPDYKGDRCYRLDIKDYEAILKLDICWEEVAFVYTSADVAVKTQLELHRAMGLLGPADDAVENALVKGKSQECWEKAGILNKFSRVIQEASEFSVCGSKKYIFKPNCSSGSRNITILEESELSAETLNRAVEHAKEASLDHLCIAEEFVEGTEYTVDMLGDNFGNVGVYGISKKYHTPYNTKNKIATKLHYAPSDVSRELLQQIAGFGKACYRAVGLKNSFGHLEVIVTDSGKIVPVEIGARSSGYIATTLVDLINDVSYLGEYQRVIQGGTVKDGIIFDGRKSSMYYFYDVKPGISRCKTTIMDYLPEEIVSYAHDRSSLEVNKVFSAVNADHERYGFEILGGPGDILTIDNVQKAEQEFNDRFISEK